jgi:hypothetical protein
MQTRWQGVRVSFREVLKVRYLLGLCLSETSSDLILLIELCGLLLIFQSCLLLHLQASCYHNLACYNATCSIFPAHILCSK